MRLTPLSRRIIIPLRFSPVKTFTAYWRILNRESAWTLWSRCWNYVAGSSKCVWEGGRCARRMRNGFENVRRRRTKSDNKNLIFRNANEYFYFRYFVFFYVTCVCFSDFSLESQNNYLVFQRLHGNVDIPSFFQYFLIFLLNVKFSFIEISIYFIMISF